MLLTSTQVSVAITTSVVVICTFALFFAGYMLQQQTVRSLQAMIVPPTLAPPAQYLDLVSTSNLENSQNHGVDKLSTQDRIEYESEIELERHRMRRTKAFTVEVQSEYGANGGKLGGYRSDTTPERFRVGRKQVDEAAKIKAEEANDRRRVEEAARRNAAAEEEDSEEEDEDEGGVTPAPWAAGDASEHRMESPILTN